MGDEGARDIYWEAADGEHSIRIVYTESKVLGFNLMGIRYRQEVCQRWLREERGLDYVLENLREANFDPELFRSYEGELLAIARGLEV